MLVRSVDVLEFVACAWAGILLVETNILRPDLTTNCSPVALATPALRYFHRLLVPAFTDDRAAKVNADSEIAVNRGMNIVRERVEHSVVHMAPQRFFYVGFTTDGLQKAEIGHA